MRAVTRRELGKGALSAWLAPIAWGAAAEVAAAARSGPSKQWRDDFPVLKQQVNGRPLAYLDSAATTQRPAAVIQALVDYYSRDNANPSSTLHTLARRAYERYEAARTTVATFIHAKNAQEIVWTRGTTEAINLVASAWGEAELRRGDEILLTLAEHSSNLLPWQLVAERTGAVVR